MNTLTCPRCHGMMQTFQRAGVSVDQCTQCRGIFLDHGELEHILNAEKSWGAQAYPQQPGYPQPGQPQPGYPQPGYPQAGYPQPGYPQQAPPPGYGPPVPGAHGAPHAGGHAYYGHAKHGGHAYYGHGKKGHGYYGHRRHGGHYGHRKSFIQELFD